MAGYHSAAQTSMAAPFWATCAHPRSRTSGTRTRTGPSGGSTWSPADPISAGRAICRRKIRHCGSPSCFDLSGWEGDRPSEGLSPYYPDAYTWSMRAFLALTILALLPCPAAADVSLQLNDGRVTLLARQASIQQVLGEWARKGRTRIVNLERVA